MGHYFYYTRVVWERFVMIIYNEKKFIPPKYFFVAPKTSLSSPGMPGTLSSKTRAMQQFGNEILPTTPPPLSSILFNVLDVSMINLFPHASLFPFHWKCYFPMTGSS